MSLASEKRVIEEQLASLNTAKTPSLGRLGHTRLWHICKGIADWLDRAGESERELALDALQVTVEDTRVSGVLPVDPPRSITNEQSRRFREVVSEEPGYPFRISFQIPVLTRKLRSCPCMQMPLGR